MPTMAKFDTDGCPRIWIQYIPELPLGFIGVGKYSTDTLLKIQLSRGGLVYV